MKKYTETYSQMRNLFFENHKKSIDENTEKVWEIETKIEEVISIANSLNFREDIKNIFTEIISDIYSGINNMYMGMYRNSYMNLRSSLELCFGLVFFLENDLYLKLWRFSKFELSWSELTKERMLINYFEILGHAPSEIKELFDDARKCYNICSEFLHGKYDYMHNIKYVNFQYNANSLNDCFKMLEKILDVNKKIFIYLRVK